MNRMDQPGALTDEMALWYVRHGATPRVVETAYHQRTGLRELVTIIGGREEDMRALADRWGIARQRDRHGE